MLAPWYPFSTKAVPVLVQSQSLVSNRFFVFRQPKAPAPNQQKRFVVAPKHCWARRKNRLRQGLGAGLPWTTRWKKLWTAIFEIAAKHGHVGFAVFGCRCRFAKPWTSITPQRPPLLIVCLGLFGMDRRYADRSVLMALYAFGSLSRCFSVLWRCRASETKHETYSVT